MTSSDDRPGRSARSHVGAAAVVCAALAVTLGALPAAAYPAPGVTERVSVASDGTEADHVSWVPAISDDGRFVAFESWATNLVPGKTTFHGDIYVHDRTTGAIELVSVASDGTEGNNRSREPAISADGRFVAFESWATNLVEDDTNSPFTLDIFVHDRATGTTERVSVASDGTEGDGSSGQASISADGRYVAFHSSSTNLVEGDTNERTDVFVHDRATGITERVSVASDGTESNGQSGTPAITADGRTVAFESTATTLTPDTTNTARDVFVHDRDTGITERVSIGSDGAQGNGGSDSASISADGRYVAFRSLAHTLVPGDTIDYIGVFVRDREAGITEKISVTTEGARANMNAENPSISADGRLVAFRSWASNLVPGDTSGVAGVFVRDRATSSTERVSARPDGSEPDGWSYPPSMSADGRFVAFPSRATDLVPGDTNDLQDIFVRDRGPATGIGGLAASPQGDAVAVSGWARLGGAVISGASDSEGDAVPGTASLGADLTEAAVTYRPEEGNLLLRLRVSTMPTSTGEGSVAQRTVVYGFRLTAGGASYEVRARRRATPAPADVPASFTLHRCEDTCTQQATLIGGIATTGPQALVSVPLSALGASEGSALTGLAAFTALGVDATGPVVSLDEVQLPAAAIPATTVGLGIAPAGTPEHEVAFDTQAALEQGQFSGTLAVSSLPAGQYRIWARACLGEACGAASEPIALG